MSTTNINAETNSETNFEVVFTMLDFIDIILYLTTGVAAGAMIVFTGFGGGIIMVPILSQVLGMPIKEAIGISMAVMSVNAVVTTSVNIRMDNIQLKTAFIMGGVSVVGVVLGSLLTIFLLSDSAVHIIFALFLVIPIILTFRSKADGLLYPSIDRVENTSLSGMITVDGREMYYETHKMKLIAYFGAGAGVLSGILGVGGASMMISLLTGVAKLPIKIAIGISSFAISIAAPVSLVIYYLAGYVNFHLVLLVLAGSYISIKISSKFIGSVTNKYVKVMFLVILILSFVKNFI